jgi:hypothetical protein
MAEVFVGDGVEVLLHLATALSPEDLDQVQSLCIRLVEAEHKLDEALLELGEIRELCGPGGDDTARGRVESMLSSLTAERDEARAELASVEELRRRACEALEGPRGKLLQRVARVTAERDEHRRSTLPTEQVGHLARTLARVAAERDEARDKRTDALELANTFRLERDEARAMASRWHPVVDQTSMGSVEGLQYDQDGRDIAGWVTEEMGKDDCDNFGRAVEALGAEVVFAADAETAGEPRCAACDDQRPGRSSRLCAKWPVGSVIPTEGYRRCTQDDGPAPDWCPRRTG